MTKGRILIVEDEIIVALDIKARLARLGYTVTGHATTGGQAVQMAQGNRPDLVLMDVMIEGGMDGIETATVMQERFALPVVYISAYTDRATLERAKHTNPLGYLTKPFEDHELSLTVEMALFKHQTEVRLQENQRLLATTLGSLSDSVLSTDTDGRLTYLNPAALSLLNIELEEAMGMEVPGLFSILEQDTRLPVSALEEICSPRSAQPLCEDMILCPPNGAEVPVSISVSPLTGPGGAFQGRVLVLRNVATKKQAEADLRASMDALKTTFRQTVRALASMAEKRDPYTGGHQHRVARLACAIGREMALPQDQLEGLEVAGTLHDVGKIYVPAEILSKPAKLSLMEMGMMRTHPEVGYEILREVSFPWPVARSVMEHHERMDGSGYPNGVMGADICLEARILAVADVVEAMSSHRPYRASLGILAALSEVENGRGTLFDAEVVDACMEIIHSGRFSLEDETTCTEAAANAQPPKGTDA